MRVFPQPQSAKADAPPRGLAFDERGTALLEFAFVAAPFIALLLAVLQTALLFFAQQSLETVAEKAARTISTGQAQTGNSGHGLTKDAFKQQVCDSLPVYMDCGSLLVDVQTAASFADIDTATPTITYDSDGNITSSTAYNYGSAGSIVILRLLYYWPVVSGPLNFGYSTEANGKHLLVAIDIAKSEPYSSGS